MKTLLKFIILVSLFFGTWFVLSRIDWMRIFKVASRTQKTEEKIGDMLWDLTRQSEKQALSETIVLPIDSLINRICIENDIDKEKIKLHVIKKDVVNAFALPNNHLVVYTGLISACDNEAELCGVLGHEIAHMEKGHVMKKLVKEVGLSAIVALASGGNNPQMVQQILRTLSSRAYDRTLESEADITSVDYMIKADIDPEPFANFLYKLGEDQAMPKQLVWISDHPESKERAEAIVNYIKGKKIVKRPVLAPETWKRMQEKLKEEQEKEKPADE